MVMFRDDATYAVTLDVCTDCVQHVEYGEGACCHDDGVAGVDAAHLRRPDGAECPTALRLVRQHPRAVAFVNGCTDPDCGDCRDRGDDGPGSWFSMSACEGCGVNLGGDREHVTMFLPEDTRPERHIIRRGWSVRIGPSTWSRSRGLDVVATRDGVRRWMRDTPHDGCDRWARVAAFLATLPVDLRK